MTGLMHRSNAQNNRQCRSWPLTGMNWKELRLAYKTFLRDPGVGIRHILKAQRYTIWQRWVVARLRVKAEHLTGRTIAIDLSELQKLPADTLGGAYARHMISLNLDPAAFITPGEDWLDQRMAIGHDLYHAITGFDAHPVGEFGVAAFTFMQYRDILNVFVLTFAPLSLTNPLWTMKLWRSMVRGWKMGRDCKPVIAFAAEDNWSKPLSAVRQELGISQYFDEIQIQP